MSHDQNLSLLGSHVRVICRRGQLYISEFGRTSTVTVAEAVAKFGYPFVEAVINCPMVWIEFDASEQARVECNRKRFSVVGCPFKYGIGGPHIFGIWDHERDCLLRGGFTTTEHYTAQYLDELTAELIEIFERGEAVIFPPPYEYKPVAVRIAAGNIAAVEAVSALFNPPPKPAA